MALIKCPECGRDASTMAAACPHCGRPLAPPPIPTAVPPVQSPQVQTIHHHHTSQPKKGVGLVGGCFLILVILLALGFAIPSIMQFTGNDTRTPVGPLVKPIPNLDAEKLKQPERWKLIEKMIEQGTFTKVTSSNPAVAHLYVGRLFQELTIDQKKDFVNVVYAYYHVEAPTELLTVVLHDGFTGKEIGSYSDGWGLRLK